MTSSAVSSARKELNQGFRNKTTSIITRRKGAHSFHWMTRQFLLHQSKPSGFSSFENRKKKPKTIELELIYWLHPFPHHQTPANNNFNQKKIKTEMFYWQTWKKKKVSQCFVFRSFTSVSNLGWYRPPVLSCYQTDNQWLQNAIIDESW